MYQQLLLLLSYFFAAILAAGSGPTILDIKNGVICSPVVQSKSMKAHIHLYVDTIDTKDSSIIDSLRFPVLIFRAPYVYNFTNIPSPELYYDSYISNKAELYKDILDTKNAKFKLEPFEGFNIDQEKVWNDFITLDHKIKEEEKHVDVDFVVPESGIYCVYIAPPHDQGITDIRVPVQFKNEYGNLLYNEYKVYSQLKWVVLFGIVLFAVLFNHILKLIGKDFKNMNQLSIISKGIIFYILGPFVTVTAFQWFCLFITNHFNSSSSGSILLSFSKLVNAWFNIYTQFVFLLFTMGYGVIYYHDGQSPQYRMFPKKQFSRIFGLFIANLVVIFLLSFLDVTSSKTQYFHGIVGGVEVNESTPSMRVLIAGALNLVILLFALFWGIAPIVYYFKTKKLIASFPPTGSESNYTERVVKSFRLSIWIILGLPIVIVFVVVYFSVEKLQNAQNSIPVLPTPTSELREIVYNSAMKFWNYEILELQPSVFLGIVWSSWAYSFVLVISVFFIWVKDNNGLIIDPQANDPIQYADVSEFNISDDEEESSQPFRP
ncbi:uncharacterized protein SPAPADRAFT_49780 [Spathaspora passalidarum NRRL Y-27907]|uniref:Uncharacterized protein n=1 Tax=Spathaspora passalidarum (strain NRRL Y-27907 / 11-Y1) TaxID=619300 RepID=G3AK32_SPAPN|nr:uncharacterized protein SPAPADRAFT_49780 [Spathaspora passalidarum NRRL Y-27907]EGW32844.1 hypothetical protein SPAPADRAFT_49780 [Spathaspora passalidarum NRRL Y-27907]